ncbi:hypothetical protein ABI004_15085, partial [Enterococcus faecium]|uniref:hypothetical protein n=1 Tax=Enterococcus faecium TaxID=1352 RepID=UPI003F41BEF5
EYMAMPGNRIFPALCVAMHWLHERDFGSQGFNNRVVPAFKGMKVASDGIGVTSDLFLKIDDLLLEFFPLLNEAL